MALGIPRPAAVPALGGMMRKGQPGHFIALTEDGRIDATCNGKFAEILEKRMAIQVSNAMESPVDGSRPPAPAAGLKSVDPYDLTVVMAAGDGMPPVSPADKEEWARWRMSYDVVLDATPFRITGTMLLFPSIDPMSLKERGTELFVPVFNPTVQVNGVPVRDVPKDVVLVNRSHLRRVNANLSR